MLQFTYQQRLENHTLKQKPPNAKQTAETNAGEISAALERLILLRLESCIFMLEKAFS